jgi:hypothetical protein
MKKREFLTIIESIENDLKATSKEIKEGKPYKLYFKELLEAKYNFMQYLNDKENMCFDLEFIKEQDKQRYNI